ncbi:MAG: hypothetical protein HYV96_04620 [Opitutae bacterium]|nr:hypothetical protein [Opitutae bacterium]
MTPREQSAPAKCNLIGYTSARLTREQAGECNLIGYTSRALPSENASRAPANGNLLGYPNGFPSLATTAVTAAAARETARPAAPVCHLLGDNDEESPSESRGYGAEVCHLIGDMTLEDDCA